MSKRKVHKKEITVHGYPVLGHEEDYFNTIYPYGLKNTLKLVAMSDLLRLAGAEHVYDSLTDNAFESEGYTSEEKTGRYYTEMCEEERARVREQHEYPKLYKVKFNVEVTEYTDEECKKYWQGKNKNFLKQMQRIKEEKEQDARK